jgi:hypothetical protein
MESVRACACLRKLVDLASLLREFVSRQMEETTSRRLSRSAFAGVSLVLVVAPRTVGELVARNAGTSSNWIELGTFAPSHEILQDYAPLAGSFEKSSQASLLVSWMRGN